MVVLILFRTAPRAVSLIRALKKLFDIQLTGVLTNCSCYVNVLFKLSVVCGG